ncbi:MAG: PH domain-containing protein [Actinomycetales bacterium]|nr:PH domain-containing protein [Actinomycetales bacterium]
MTNIESFRPTSAVVISYIGYALLAGAILQSFVTANISDIIFTLIATAVFGTFIYLVIHRPKLEIGDEGVLITNPLSKIFLNWGDVIEIETKYSLTFYTAERKYSSWAALAPGRYHHRTVHPNEVKGLIPRDTTLIRAGDSPRTDSGAAAYIARVRWEQFKKRHHD